MPNSAITIKAMPLNKRIFCKAKFDSGLNNIKFLCTCVKKKHPFSSNNNENKIARMLIANEITP